MKKWPDGLVAKAVVVIFNVFFRKENGMTVLPREFLAKLVLGPPILDLRAIPSPLLAAVTDNLFETMSSLFILTVSACVLIILHQLLFLASNSHNVVYFEKYQIST